MFWFGKMPWQISHLFSFFFPFVCSARDLARISLFDIEKVTFFKSSRNKKINICQSYRYMQLHLLPLWKKNRITYVCTYVTYFCLMTQYINFILKPLHFTVKFELIRRLAIWQKYSTLHFTLTWSF